MGLTWNDLDEDQRRKAIELYELGLAEIQSLKDGAAGSAASRQIEKLAKAFDRCNDAALARLNFQDPFISSWDWPSFEPVYSEGRDFVWHLRQQLVVATLLSGSSPGRHKNLQYIRPIEFLVGIWIANDCGEFGLGQKISSDTPNSTSAFKAFLIDCLQQIDPATHVYAPRFVESSLQALEKMRGDLRSISPSIDVSAKPKR
ncbi:MAG: hypothetical protein EON58_02110 [Alphaproteobacteria bacterium]|nr:MAG: hypothetical protein EON58_02110 [Alphaproteobacteria bacterium]